MLSSYENLRSSVLGEKNGNNNNFQGLTQLVCQGMASWIKNSINPFQEEIRDKQSCCSILGVEKHKNNNVPPEMIVAMANMILNNQRKGVKTQKKTVSERINNPYISLKKGAIF